MARGRSDTWSGFAILVFSANRASKRRRRKTSRRTFLVRPVEPAAAQAALLVPAPRPRNRRRRNRRRVYRETGGTTSASSETSYGPRGGGPSNEPSANGDLTSSIPTAQPRLLRSRSR